MSTVQQFLLYNLLPSVVAGALLWLAISVATPLLRIKHGPLRLCLLTAPLAKSTFILLGVGLVLPWPAEVFAIWHENAIPFGTMLPIFLVFTAAVLMVRTLLVRRSKRLALRDARPAEGQWPRLEHALDRVMSAYDTNDARVASVCPGPLLMERPRLMVTNRLLHSPLVVTAGRPTIVFPAALVSELGDVELEGALAHELAHVRLRKPALCSSENIQALAAVNPMAALMASHLHREEEKACDDIAVAAVGKPDAYAEMLLKSYRFAAQSTAPMVGTLQFVPQLLGVKPMLSERIERLLQTPLPQAHLKLQFLATCALWVGMWGVFFRF